MVYVYIFYVRGGNMGSGHNGTPRTLGLALLHQQLADEIQQILVGAFPDKTGGHLSQYLQFGIFSGFHSRRSFHFLSDYDGIVIKQKWKFNTQICQFNTPNLNN